MNINDFDFELPDELIAQFPPQIRGSSRLLIATLEKTLQDTNFQTLPEYLHAGDVLVINDTKVIKARLFGQKTTGGKVEILIERIIDAHTAQAHIKASKAPKTGTKLQLEQNIFAECIGRDEDLFLLKFDNQENLYELLEDYGHLPLPPYITRDADDKDDARYQTIYSKEQGAVAAPTAGLHFTDEILQQLQNKGVIIAPVTLHVGAGTFQPVRVENIQEHIMHKERYFIPQSSVSKIETAKNNGNRICAVGTTSLRALESANLSGRLCAGNNETDIFITPGFEFKIVDCLLTNFHLPRSTLLMLVSAFAGFDYIREIYQHAIQEKYRFFSYGDAMLLYRNK